MKSEITNETPATEVEEEDDDIGGGVTAESLEKVLDIMEALSKEIKSMQDQNKMVLDEVRALNERLSGLEKESKDGVADASTDK